MDPNDIGAIEAAVDASEIADEDFQFHSFAAKDYECVASSIAQIEKVACEDKIIAILQRYQEQPELLDPHIEAMVTPMMDMIRRLMNDPTSQAVCHRVFRVIYTLAKVRGYKTIVKFFPHAVADLEPALSFLQKQSSTDFETWQTRYSLLLWLSMIVLIPFDLATVDSNSDSTSIVAKLVSVAQQYLSDAGPTRDMAAVLLSRLFSRTDLQDKSKEVNIGAFIDWACRVLQDKKSDQFLLTGVFQSLAHIFKLLPRDSLLPYVPQLHAVVNQTATSSNVSNAMFRKLSVKLLQRVALTFLQPKDTAWRYQMEKRQMLSGLVDSTGTSSSVVTHADDDSEDISPEVEDIIGNLLDALSDKDTVVRWSAAKGVGRITARLSKSLADEIVASLLERFDLRQPDSAWHGACLAFAELARRGLLLPVRLAELMPLIEKALLYEVSKGSHSVGAHVRDAACYVCWAFARAYQSVVLQPFSESLAKALITLAVFDRDINCRRAAAAAFQEHVGRQGNFPHGIAVNTTADYIALGNRVNAYMDIAPRVAVFPEYRRHLLDHLLSNKLRHWDKSLRELSAKSIGLLCGIGDEADYVIASVLPKLLSDTLSTTLEIRHGAALAAAEIVVALARLNRELPADIQTQLRNAIPKIEAARLFMGRGGVYMRSGVCKLVECMGLAKLQLPEKTVLRLQDSIDECLRNPLEEIQTVAVSSFSVFASHYYAESTAVLQTRVVDRLVTALTDSNPSVVRGACQALGVLPAAMLLPQLTKVVHALARATRIQEQADLRDAETRKFAVESLARICFTVRACDPNVVLEFNASDPTSVAVSTNVSEPSVEIDLDEFGNVVEKVASAVQPVQTVVQLDWSEFERNDSTGGPALAEFICNVCLRSVRDYSLDKRGDVGSWVREAAMHALKSILLDMLQSGCLHLNSSLMNRVFCALIKQMMEKINRVRTVAGKCFFELLHAKSMPFIPHHTELLIMFPDTLIVDWSAPGEMFPRLVYFLALSQYRASALAGMSLSVGGLTESLIRHSGSSLLAFVKSLVDQSALPTASADTSRLILPISLPSHSQLCADLCNDFLSILTTNRGDARVVLPTWKTIELLLENDAFRKYSGFESFPAALFSSVRSELGTKGSANDVGKIRCASTLYIALLSCGTSQSTDILVGVLVLLAHKYPKIRKLTSDQLYSRLLATSDIVPDSILDDVLSILMETPWDGSAADAIAATEKLFELLQLQLPSNWSKLKSVATTTATEIAAKIDESMSYKDLVRDFHY